MLPIILSFLSFLGSQALSTNSPACSLNFTAYPYKPVGECLQPDAHELIVWGNVRTTQCCRSGLDTLSGALAMSLNASGDQDKGILLAQQSWQNCISNFCMQHPDSLSSCAFDIIRQDNANCSVLTRRYLRTNYTDLFGSAIRSCSQFDAPSFDGGCANCTSDISRMIIKLVQDFQVQDNDNEKAICSVVTVVAVASNWIRNDTWSSDYYRCLTAMDSEDPVWKPNKRDVLKIILEALIVSMALLLIITLFKFKTRKKADEHKEVTDVPGKVVSLWSGLYRFSKAEIEKAIQYSNSRVCLGAGSAGQVYQGVLPSGQLVAIKHMYKTAMNSSFTREVEGLSKVRHHNLVSLLGYCDEKGDKYLVYEYCSNGNLAQRLLSTDTPLPWEKRIKILRDCSLALRFLHTHPDGCIVHRDIKLTNILLTESMEPKLSDFGLARMAGMKETQCFTDVRGTIGYMDPEYMTNGNLTCSSDIYSFGIVMLQVLSGRKVIELDTEARETLTRKAKDVSAGKRPLQDFVDPRLKGELNLEDFKSILSIAVLCVASSSNGRPRINDVVGELEKAYKNLPAQFRRQLNASSRSRSQSSEVIEV